MKPFNHLNALAKCAALSAVIASAPLALASNQCQLKNHRSIEGERSVLVTIVAKDHGSASAEDLLVSKVPADQKSDKDAKQDKQEEVSWYSWLTDNHSMPNFHFIDLLELFE